MNTNRNIVALMLLLTLGTPSAFAQKKPAAKPHTEAVKMVAYDAKDKKYYSVAWAKAHGMKDKGGDTLIVIPMSKLPKDAKMSKQMHGKM